MSKIDKFFDMNMVLMALFSSLETVRDEKNIELIYDIDATIPKELKGNPEAVAHLLTQILTFTFENSRNKEIVLSLIAPEDFLYEESIAFEIRETGMSKEKVSSFLENRLTKNLELVDGEIVYNDENPSAININIPFKLNELGNRRYYRLPDMVMLGKKVLLLCENPKVAKSIEKMFKYFLYDVVVGITEYKRLGSNMTEYDILVIDDKIVTTKFEELIVKVQKKVPLKYVLLQNSNYLGDHNEHIEASYLVKPVMQESIFDLIISLFQDQVLDRSIIPKDKKTIINMDKYIDDASKNGIIGFEQKSKKREPIYERKERRDTERVVLNTTEGEKNVKKSGLEYSSELKKFLDTFDHADIYFRQIVNQKQTWQIKEFCIDLEKHSKMIGAQSMSIFADKVSLLFVYNNLDSLPIYTAKFHKELKKLITEIKTHLNSL